MFATNRAVDTKEAKTLSPFQHETQVVDGGECFIIRSFEHLVVAKINKLA